MAALLLVVAAGGGTRLGRSEPKALVPLAGRPMLAWTLESLAGVAFARSVVTAPPGRIEECARVAGDGFRVVPGGETRAASVRRGVDALAPRDGDIVCIHDAARPFPAVAEVLAVLEAAEKTGAAIAVLAIVDTVKRVGGGRVLGTLDRSELAGAATPQAFRGSVLRRALASGLEATDEAGLCEALALPVAAVPVSRLAFKITTPEDLGLAEAVIAARSGRVSA
jgi:2-C-methyl-D-erythritol 4-phosphate cytidylyltransferase